MFRRFTKKRAAVGLGGVVAIAMAAGAYAYFTATGTGTGTASVGSASAWNVTSSTAGGPMYPGTTSGDQTVTVNIKNVGSGKQAVNSFTIKVANGDGSPWTSSITAYPSETACSASDFALGTNTTAGSYTVDHSVDATLPDDLAPNATYTTTVKLHMLDTGVPQDNCQGLTTVPLYISAN